MELSITLQNPGKAGMLFGPADKHLRMIRDAMGVQIFARGGQIRLTGSAGGVTKASQIIERLQRQIERGQSVSADSVSRIIGELAQKDVKGDVNALDVYVGGQLIQPKTEGQKQYLQAASKRDLVFCTGPAGTGKTYLAVALAVHMLKHRQAKRLVLVRPAVEAGEKLGFLPGDMQAKVNPYLRPLFDALHDMMDFDQIRRFMVNDVIEVIPLAFMRGRTLNESIIILDEAQNTTPGQMLMFLTRMGHGSKVIVTGDASQTDLEDGQRSGLIDAIHRLKGIKGISVVQLEKADIVRHHIVQNIVDAYERTGTPKTGDK